MKKQHARANPIYRPLRLVREKEGMEKDGKAHHAKNCTKSTGTTPHMRPPTTQVSYLQKLSKILGRKVATIKRAWPPHTQKMEIGANPIPGISCGRKQQQEMEMHKRRRYKEQLLESSQKVLNK